MTMGDKDLLLRDLCARLPYGVKILYNGWDSDGGCEFSTVETLIGIDDGFIYTLWRGEKDKHSIKEPLSILDYKPFLRPMDSMTEEEKIDYGAFFNYDGIEYPEEYIDWLNKNMFDYRGLIERGLALEATEEMYNIKK